MNPVLTDEQFKEYMRMAIAFDTWYTELYKTLNKWIAAVHNSYTGKIREFTIKIDILQAYDCFVAGGYPVAFDLNDYSFITFYFPAYKAGDKKMDAIEYTYKEFQHELTCIMPNNDIFLT